MNCNNESFKNYLKEEYFYNDKAHIKHTETRNRVYYRYGVKLMNYTPDKILHYDFCYRATNKIKWPVLRQLWAIIVFIGVSGYKEFINDLACRKGTFDLKDIQANFDGCFDAAMNRKAKY